MRGKDLYLMFSTSGILFRLQQFTMTDELIIHILFSLPEKGHKEMRAGDGLCVVQYFQISLANPARGCAAYLSLNTIKL